MFGQGSKAAQDSCTAFGESAITERIAQTCFDAGKMFSRNWSFKLTDYTF